MLESCVAPILILIITMFYTKNEQVRSFPVELLSHLTWFVGSANFVVLSHGITPPKSTFYINPQC